MKQHLSSTITAAPKQDKGGQPSSTTSPSPVPETQPSPPRHFDIGALPKETRDMINLMLDDGLPYHILIEELGEEGQGLKTQSLIEWVKGRYQDHLKHREHIESVKSELEFAADLVRELGNSDPTLIYRACSMVAASQIFDAVMKHGNEALSDMI